ncbi:MAG: benzoate-CoA ligase family protein [Cyanobacteria bacterium J06639_18]
MFSVSEHIPQVFNVAAYFIEKNLKQGLGEKIAFYYRDETYTYIQVKNFVERTAKLLSHLNLERENRIAILLPDSPEFVFSFWGAIWLGAVPVPINTTTGIDDIQYILNDCRAKILLTNKEWEEKLTPIESPFLGQILCSDGDNSFMTLLGEQDEGLPHGETSSEEPAFWLYTSGSTGRPKGVIHLHQNMVVCAENYGKSVLELGSDDILYSVAKMPFAYGLGNSLYMPMAVGASAVLSDANNAFDIVADIGRYRPTVFFGIPSVYTSILAVEEICPFDVSSLRLCVSAAEQLPKSVWYKWQEIYDLEICEGIGTTEFLHIFLSNFIGQSKPGSSGLPVPGYFVQVVDENGMRCFPGEIGNLEVSGDSLMLGYWNRLQQTRKVIYGKTMRTGDKYVCDREGYFWFMGRKDDLFKVNGQWTSPMEIEDVLHQHPQILEVAVLPESEAGEQLTQVVAFVTLNSGIKPSTEIENSIRQFAKKRLPHFKAPKKVYFVTNLPRTSTGKIHRQLLGQKQNITLQTVNP